MLICWTGVLNRMVSILRVSEIPVSISCGVVENVAVRATNLEEVLKSDRLMKDGVGKKRISNRW